MESIAQTSEWNDEKEQYGRYIKGDKVQQRGWNLKREEMVQKIIWNRKEDKRRKHTKKLDLRLELTVQWMERNIMENGMKGGME